MAKFIKSITLLLLFCLTASAATAMVEVQSNKNDQRKGLRVTSFLDYPPFGEVVTAEYSVPKMHTIYDQFIENYAKDNHYDLAYVLDKPYKDLVMDILRGEIDLILGIYYDTDIYNGIEYVYPSILNNPMTAVMLPNRIGEVKKMDDLKKLKGGMDSREHLAGYVSKAMKNYNVEYIDNSEELYKKTVHRRNRLRFHQLLLRHCPNIAPGHSQPSQFYQTIVMGYAFIHRCFQNIAPQKIAVCDTDQNAEQQTV